MAPRFQLATPLDAEDVSDLDCAVFPEEGLGPSIMRQEISLGWGMMVFEGHLLVGYALVRPGPMHDLTRLGVREGYRGQGIGAALLNAARIAHPTGQMMLLVRKKNQPAIDMYSKAGFIIAGTRETSWLMLG
jgi:ribosomal protein S18 acetylase RimI-like enzyme